MRAVTSTQYGNPEEVLKITEVPKPSPKTNEVLIRIKATAINDYDWSIARGKPFLYRLIFGLTKPKNPIAGMELSGIVESIGSEVKSLEVGDEVFGDISSFGFGTFAEYIAINERVVVKKPSHISFEEAAAIPHAGLLAWQAMIDLGKIEANQKVLINGAGGGVGALAIQIAKNHHCEVTAVDTSAKFNAMTDLGADHVLDYQSKDFTKLGLQYDLIIDCKTSSSPKSYLRALSKQGKYITVGGRLKRLVQLLLFRSFSGREIKQKLNILSLKPNQGLSEVADYILKNQLKIVLDGSYTLEDIPRLIQYFGDGKHQGKIVISV